MAPLRAFPATANSRALACYQVGAEGYNYNTFAGIVYGNATGVEEFVPASLMTSAGAPAAAMGYFGGYNRRPCGSVEEGGGGEERARSRRRGALAYSLLSSGGRRGRFGRGGRATRRDVEMINESRLQKPSTPATAKRRLRACFVKESL